MPIKAHIIDPKIIDGCKKKDKKSQEILFRTLYGTLLRTCMIYASNRADAEDYLQNGFIQIFKNIHKYSGLGNFEGWARKTVRNLVITELRKKNVLSFYNVEEIGEYDKEDMSDDGLLMAYKGISAKKIINTIQHLPPSYRIVFNLRVVDEMTHKEIAEFLKISENTSKTNYRRAKLWLLKKIGYGEVNRIYSEN